LKVTDNDKDQHGGQEIGGQIGQVLTVPCLLESSDFVCTSNQQVEESNDGTLKLGTSSSVHGSWRKGFPLNRFTNVGSNE
jgi:hypothetical protein